MDTKQEQSSNKPSNSHRAATSLDILWLIVSNLHLILFAMLVYPLQEVRHWLRGGKYPVFKSMLTGKTTIAEFDRSHFQSVEWQTLKAQIQLGDELWRYSDVKGSGFVCGNEGVALVRNGEIISHIVLWCIN